MTDVRLILPDEQAIESGVALQTPSRERSRTATTDGSLTAGRSSERRGAGVVPGGSLCATAFVAAGRLRLACGEQGRPATSVQVATSEGGPLTLP
jgi:hypothetical protein